MKKQQKKTRLSASERRGQIIDVSARLFAQRGLHGVTTKEIAKACKISEPILYQHFQSKEHIYEALQTLCQGQTVYFHRVLKTIRPGAEGLIVAVFLLCHTITAFRDPSRKDAYAEISEVLTRLMGFSFLEDGRFAKILIKECIGSVMPYMISAYKAAKEQGEIADTGSMNEDLWLSYELIIGSALFNLNKPGLIPSLSEDDALVFACMNFILRGLGLKENAIKKLSTPKQLKKFIAVEA